MSNYIKITDYQAKDSLLTGDPAKLVKGTEIGADFDAVVVAVATKHDSSDIGVTVQAYSANLDEYAAVNPTASGLAILDDATASDQLTTLGGTTVGKAVFTAATVAAAQQATDTEVGVDVMAYVAPGTSGNVLTSNGSTWESAADTSTEEGITQYFHPAAGSAYQDLYRSGWLPSWFNQQWGGAQWGTLPDGSFGSVATGNVQDDTVGNFGNTAGQYYYSSGFKVAETTTFDAVWVKLTRTGTPTGPITARIYTDNGSGKPNAATGSAGTLACKLVTSKSDGEWYQITGLAAALTAGTQYHLTLTTGGTDASNYIGWKCTTSSKYPHGLANYATSAPSWTSSAGQAQCFLIQNPAANSLIQSGGMFDAKLCFNPGTPANQSRSVAQPLANFYDGKTCSVLYRGTFAVSTNVWDFTYGLDHDRITLTINSSGYPVLTIYESDRTVATVTGTGSVASGNHDVGIRVRTVGDGSDYATLYVDGVSVGTPLTAQTFTMDVNMVLLGTARLGDGFGLAPTWTQDMQMTSLPSAQGWTWTGTATEANAMSIQGGKLYQNANGYTSTQTGYYTKTVVFVNATGWTVDFKVRLPQNVNTVANASSGAGQSVFVTIKDGSKGVAVTITEYFLSVSPTASATPDFVIQGDFKSVEHVFCMHGKGSNYYLFMDGKLVVDGTGKLTEATATNSIEFGDGSATASENADAIWSYVKYYQGGMILPVANTGTCSEFAHWSGDKSALLPSLYNGGSQVSVKQLCGVPRNYQMEAVVQNMALRGVTNGPTTSGTAPSYVVLADTEAYVIGADLNYAFGSTVYNTSAGSGFDSYGYVDGSQQPGSRGYASQPTAQSFWPTTASGVSKLRVTLGLHKLDTRFVTVGAGTATANGTTRMTSLEARS